MATNTSNSRIQNLSFVRRWYGTGNIETRFIRCSYDQQKEFFAGVPPEQSMPHATRDDIDFLLNTTSDI
jgi:hypothetical protein